MSHDPAEFQLASEPAVAVENGPAGVVGSGDLLGLRDSTLQIHMKIIIEHNGVKRLIEGTGFNICASPDDLKTIAETITREDMSGYGWLRIRDPQPDDHACSQGTKLLPWA